MKKFNAKSLEEALLLASKDLNCLVTDLEYEILQSPSKGFLGLFSKDAIIVVNDKAQKSQQNASKNEMQDFAKNSESEQKKQESENLQALYSTSAQNLKKPSKKFEQDNEAQKQNEQDSHKDAESYESAQDEQNSESSDRFFDKYSDRIYSKSKQRYFDDYTDSVWGSKPQKQERDNEALAEEIKEQLVELFSLLPFDIDSITTSINQNLLSVNIEGRDCALLIGEKGYRYKALSYLIFNWVGPKYGLTLRLEVAEFLKNQEQMMDIYLENVIRSIDENGSGQTKPLDGILAYIGLRKLREAFPYKNVHFGVNEEGTKYVIVSEGSRRGLDSERY